MKHSGYTPGPRTRPCGFVLTGRLKTHLAHYRACSHPVCKEHLEAWEAIKEMHRADLRKQMVLQSERNKP